MRSYQLGAIRTGILGIPATAIIVGLVAAVVVTDIGVMWPIFWIGIAATILFVLWHMATMIEESAA